MNKDTTVPYMPEALLDRAGIGYDHIYRTETGYQIECYGRRIALLIRRLQAAGFVNVTGFDSQVTRPLVGDRTWYATANFEMPPRKTRPHRTVYLINRRLTIMRGARERTYDVDRYPVTDASALRLMKALNKMEARVELDDFTPTIYFHSPDALPALQGVDVV